MDWATASTTTRSRQPSRFALNRRRGMANQPIPLSSCTLFFSWRNSLPEGFYAHFAGRYCFSLVCVGVVFPGVFSGLHIFPTPLHRQRRLGTKRNYACPASRIFQ